MKNIKTRDLIYCALFAALTAIGAFLHFQLFQATITLQFFFTAMAGLLLGAKLGALSQLLYVVLGLVGGRRCPRRGSSPGSAKAAPPF